MFIESFTTRQHCTSNYTVTALSSCRPIRVLSWNLWKCYYNKKRSCR